MLKPSYLEVAVAAARRAGEIQLAGLRRPIRVNQTSSHDVKLQIDLDCEAAIRGMILDAFPDHAMLAEEGGGTIADDVPTWIVDPLDGTVNYSRHIPFFCTSISVRQAGEETIGVVYAPIYGELYVAEKGKGAFLNGEPIRVSEVSRLADAIIAVGCGKAESSVIPAVNTIKDLAFTARKVRILGAAALDIAYVAAGRMDGYFECGLRTWDIAAATLLLREAGGRAQLAPTGEHAWDVRIDNGKIW
ncbi:MAG: inositol monophosphatase family protein [Armatimonadota bacterium]